MRASPPGLEHRHGRSGVGPARSLTSAIADRPAVPSAEIRQARVLRDAAAAQYGLNAVDGVPAASLGQRILRRGRLAGRERLRRAQCRGGGGSVAIGNAAGPFRGAASDDDLHAVGRASAAVDRAC